MKFFKDDVIPVTGRRDRASETTGKDEGMDREERVSFRSGRFDIEGLYRSGDGVRGVVITHPHSQMGGSMMNNVVEAMAAAMHDQGCATLRFNFRGVGGSGGSFDNGIGEQDDVRGALAFLAEEGMTRILLSGYSFGAWVNSRVAADGEGFSDFIMVSPPLDLLEFDLAALREKCALIICGDRDQFCPLGRVEEAAAYIGARLEIVHRTDHFFYGQENVLTTLLRDYLMATRHRDPSGAP